MHRVAIEVVLASDSDAGYSVGTREFFDLYILVFAASVTRELRTPPAIIRSAAENRVDGVVSTESHVRKYGSIIDTEGRRLTQLLEHTLAVSEIGSSN